MTPAEKFMKCLKPDTLEQDKKCQPCWYIILSTMSRSTTTNGGFAEYAAVPEKRVKIPDDMDWELALRLSVTADESDLASDLAIQSDKLGIDLISIQDHPHNGSFFDTWTMMIIIMLELLYMAFYKLDGSQTGPRRFHPIRIGLVRMDQEC